MSIDLTTESPLSLAEAARIIPGGVSVATCWRWVQRGVRGVRLESYVIGGRRLTTHEAIERFISATTAVAAARCGQSPTLPITATRRREVAAAEAYCQSAGI